MSKLTLPFTKLAGVLLICSQTIATGPLPPVISLSPYNIRQDAITLSGFSSGASMATQVHISHSSLFHGVALFSQAFYRCGPSSLVEFGLRCSNMGLGIFPFSYKNSVADAVKYEKQGVVDPLRWLEGQRVFIWTGALDEYVPVDMALDNARFYNSFISNSSSISTTLFHATHLLPTTNYGAACDKDAGGTVYLGNCNYSGAFHALEFILRDKVKLVYPFDSAGQPLPNAGGTLLAYNQSELYDGRDIREAAMGNIGFIFIPKSCQDKRTPCFLHINFHGCNEWPPEVALEYIQNNGFLPVAAANNIILVFPLTTKVPTNMNGCWDFFSYTGTRFATKEGPQVRVIRSLLSKLGI